MHISTKWISFVAILWVFGVLVWGCAKPVRSSAVNPITPLYAMTLAQAEDNVDYPLSTLRGKVVLVDFFASSCMPCLYIIPHLKSLYQTNRQQGFLVVGVALEQQVKRLLVPFLNYMKIDYPVLVADDSIYRGSTVFGRILRIPQSVLIDRCGTIRRVYVGVPEMKQVQREISTLLLQSADRCPKT